MQTFVDTNSFKPGMTPRKIVASLKRSRNKGASVSQLASRTGCPITTVRRRVSEMVWDGVLVHADVIIDENSGREVNTYRLS